MNVAGSTQDPEDRKRLLNHVREAISTVRQFEGRVQDRNIWQQIHSETDRLEKAAAIF